MLIGSVAVATGKPPCGICHETLSLLMGDGRTVVLAVCGCGGSAELRIWSDDVPDDELEDTVRALAKVAVVFYKSLNNLFSSLVFLSKRFKENSHEGE